MEKDNYDDIGYESGAVPSQNELVYNHLELEIIAKFTHLQNYIHESEKILESGQVNTIYWITNIGKPEEKRTVTMRATAPVIWQMKQIATNMYEEYFYKDEKMKEVADFILSQPKEEEKRAREFEINEMGLWWDKE